MSESWIIRSVKDYGPESTTGDMAKRMSHIDARKYGLKGDYTMGHAIKPEQTMDKSDLGYHGLEAKIQTAGTPPKPENEREPFFNEIGHYRPPIGSKAEEEGGAYTWDTTKQMPAPRSMWDRYRKFLQFNTSSDEEFPTAGHHWAKPSKNSWWDFIWAPLQPLMPELYEDAYMRPNPCPEELWVWPWKWPGYKHINPKIPPPVDGRYQDMYHYLAFRNWWFRERRVYGAECWTLREMFERCTMKENKINMMKNCRHLWNKYFAMTRAEEFNQVLLYMAITGNVAIRETPYPPDFLEQKRKIYDDWLFRTRMKKPGDPF
jgi:hypothetical protein